VQEHLEVFFGAPRRASERQRLRSVSLGRCRLEQTPQGQVHDFSQGRPPVPGPFRSIGRMRTQERFHIGACALVPVGRLLVRQFPVQDPELEGSIRAARQGVPAIGAQSHRSDCIQVAGEGADALAAACLPQLEGSVCTA